MAEFKSPEALARMIVTRKSPTGKMDPSLPNAIRLILQNQGKKKMTTADMSIVTGDEHSVNQVMRRVHGALVAEAKDISDVELKDIGNKFSGSKDALANQIAQALNRYSSMDTTEDKGMLLLISALVLLSVSDDRDNINSTVRRLLTAGLAQMRKK